MKNPFAVDTHGITCNPTSIAPQASGLAVHWDGKTNVFTYYGCVANHIKLFTHFNAISYGFDPTLHIRPKQLVLGLRPGETPASYRIPKSIEVRYLRNLHVKAYFLYKGAKLYSVLVGSMNLVYAGMAELLVEVTDSRQLRALERYWTHLWTCGGKYE